MIEVGSIFHNRYKILSVLGRGGTSVVYLVKDQKLNIKLAIKEIEFLNTNNTKYDISTRQLTMSEVQLLKNLKHPAIPAVYDVICDAEHICIVMEFIDGISLDALLRVHGPQRAEDVLNWAHQLAHFLSFIHEQSIIYRDMKPANIILCPNGHLKIVEIHIKLNLFLPGNISVQVPLYLIPVRIGLLVIIIVLCEFLIIIIQLIIW